MSNTEELTNPIYLSVAAHALINACQKMITETIETGTALDLVQLQKHLDMASLFLSTIETEAEKPQTKRKYEKPDMKDIFDFKN
ncbi:MAG: hypothetical protein ACYDH1_01490 [Anaerolineaceae bacterium]